MRNMAFSRIISLHTSLILPLFVRGTMQDTFFRGPKGGLLLCNTPRTRCFRRVLSCPSECRSPYSVNSKGKSCYVNCNSPTCSSECRHRKPNCNGIGSACYDPRFIGGDGVVFSFHGKSNQIFSLGSDLTLQINAWFIGPRPMGWTCDNTWIQALGILFNSHSFSLEATKAAIWDANVDHLSFTYDGSEMEITKGPFFSWYSPGRDIMVERISNKNSVVVTLKGMAEIMVNIVPITKEEDRIHKYMLPSDDCFVHMEVQFRFFGLSSKVEGVLGRTYQTYFVNPANPGVAMPVVGGEDKYRTTSLLSADCKFCIFSPGSALNQDNHSLMMSTDYGTLDCTGGASAGSGSSNGIVCKK